MRFERREDSPVGKGRNGVVKGKCAQTGERKLLGVYEQSLCPAAGNLEGFLNS